MNASATSNWWLETETLPTEEDRTPFCPDTPKECGYYIMHKNDAGQDRALSWFKERAAAEMAVSSPLLLAALEQAVEALAMCTPNTRHGDACQRNAILGGQRAIAAAKAGMA